VRQSLDDLVRRRIATLEARLATERDIYLRTPIYELLAQHQRAGLIAQADENVAARLVSAPSANLAPDLPNRSLLLLLLAVTVPLACLLIAACRVLLLGLPPVPGRAGLTLSPAVLARGEE